MRRWIATASVVALLAAPACSADGGSTCRAGSRCADAGRDARADGADAGEGPDAEPGDAGDPTAREVTSLAIEPADPTLVVRAFDPMAPPRQAFRVIGVQRNGERVTLTNGTWSLEHPRLGAIGGDGTFTANGVAGGRVEVRVEAPGAGMTALRAATTLTVRVEREFTGMGVPANPGMLFSGAIAPDATRAPTVVYPLDNAFMPNNVAPPDVQWNPIGQNGDVFRVRVTRPSVTVTAYLVAADGFRHGWPVDRAAWRSIAESDPDAPVTVSVDRWDSATRAAYAARPVEVQLAHGSIAGAIYYWALDQGRIVRIDAQTAERQNFMPSPPQRMRAGSPPSRCVACHTISRDGRYLSAELWDGGDNSTVFDLTADLSRDPAPTVFPTNVTNYIYSSFNADATRLVINQGNAFAMIDPRSGMSVAATGLPTSGAAHPEWSPDGNHIAYISDTDGGWAVDFSRGNLALLPRTGGDAFGPPRVIHRGADLAGAPERGSADSHPTWTPDSRWVAFAHGTHSRSITRDGAGTATQQPGSLYLVSRDGGAALRLDNAVGGASATNSYWPTFSPFTTTQRGGGASYFWLAFYSVRPYGNARAGTAGTPRRQLWVTAINASPRAGSDPSRVPYWLPGQDVAADNMAAYWAPQACRTNNATCTTSSECCSGQCLPDPMMPMRFTCQPPPASQCRREGATCGGASDCCMGLMCVGNVCQAPPG